MKITSRRFKIFLGRSLISRFILSDFFFFSVKRGFTYYLKINWNCKYLFNRTLIDRSIISCHSSTVKFGSIITSRSYNSSKYSTHYQFSKVRPAKLLTGYKRSIIICIFEHSYLCHYNYFTEKRWNVLHRLKEIW